MIQIQGNVRYDKVEKQALIDVASVYYISVGNGWIHNERFLDLSELIYVTEGNLHILVNGSPVELAAGDIYAIRRYTVLSGARVSEGMCSFYTVSFLSTLESSGVIYSQVIRPPASSSFADSLFVRLNLAASDNKSDRYVLDAYFIILLDELVKACRKEPEGLRLQEIISYINAGLSGNLTINEISAEFHYSGDHIARLFKEQYHITIRQYIIQKKLSTAKRLLTTSELPIRQVGASLGFRESELFEKFFRYHEKITPAAYRKRFR